MIRPATGQCLSEAPPELEPVNLDGPPGCPDRYVGCLSLDAGLALERNLRTSLHWEREAWVRCGPMPKPPPDGGEPDAGADAGVADAGTP